MKAIIADDEVNLSEDLRCRLQLLWPELQIVAIVHDGVAAAAALIKYQPDIAFLDIRMPGITGLEAANSASSACRLVFVTAFNDHAVQAFEQAAVDYLLKPVSDARLVSCIARLKRQMPVMPDDLLFRLQAMLSVPVKPEPLRWLRAQAGQTVRLVAVEEVSYFQSADKYTLVVTSEGELLLRTPLKELLEQLDPEIFWQVHRGTVVNVRHVLTAHHDLLGHVSLSLRNRPEKILVSRRYAPLFKQM